jgi:hypothetical protein
MSATDYRTARGLRAVELGAGRAKMLDPWPQIGHDVRPRRRDVDELVRIDGEIEERKFSRQPIEYSVWCLCRTARATSGSSL